MAGGGGGATAPLAPPKSATVYTFVYVKLCTPILHSVWQYHTHRRILHSVNLGKVNFRYHHPDFLTLQLASMQCVVYAAFLAAVLSVMIRYVYVHLVTEVARMKPIICETLIVHHGLVILVWNYLANGV